MHGEYKNWWDYSSRILKIRTTLKEGKYHGEFKQWLNTGQLWIHDNYLNGLKNGVCKRYWTSTGVLFIREHYINGLINGEYKMWHENGELKWNFFCIDNKVQGDEIIYYDNCELESEYIKDKVEDNYKEWWNNGQLKIQTTHNKERKNNGKYKEWDKEGNLIKDTTYVEGVEVISS
jgi:antitoxin component YwqK of YwqJK toxin-antitoxin module